MYANPKETFESAILNALTPREKLLVWEWADKHRMLSTKDSAEAGPYRTARTPYLKEIMEELSSDYASKVVVFKKGAQVGATTVGLNWLGYIIDYDPGMTMVVWPSLPDAKKNSKIRLDPLIESTPVLMESIGNGGARDSKNTGNFKDFDGGALIVSGANSASSLRSVPAKNLFLDEVDGYPDDVEGEGDPIGLCLARSRTFSKRKAFFVSTPTYAGESKIDREFIKSDQRWFYVPCPHCGEYQILGHEDRKNPLEVFNYLQYETKKVEIDEDTVEVVTTASMFCKKCGVEIQEHFKPKMFAAGEWRKHNPDSNVPGFMLSGVYSPLGWYSWKDICQDYVDAKNSGEENKMKTFVNTGLGEVFEHKGERPAEKVIYERRELYTVGTVPIGAIFLTCAVDVQGDRLEAEVHGWGRRRERWVIERKILDGDPKNSEVWDELEEYISSTFDYQGGGEMGLSMVVIDSGDKTQDVYRFCSKFDHRKVRPIKGMPNQSQILGIPSAVHLKNNGKRVRTGLKLWGVGVNLIKSELYGDLKKEHTGNIDDDAPEGYIHFPMLDKEYFAQLVAEEKRLVKNKKGYTVVEWHKKRERNETLDLHVYNRAAASMVGIDRFKEKDWQKLESKISIVQKLQRKDNSSSKPNNQKKANNRKKGTGYW